MLLHFSLTKMVAKTLLLANTSSSEYFTDRHRPAKFPKVKYSLALISHDGKVCVSDQTGLGRGLRIHFLY